MPYPINEDLLPLGEQTNRPGTLIKVRFLVAHRTGNSKPTANARMHRVYFGGGYRAASAHTFTDKDEILTIIPWEKNPECAYHAGLITSKTWGKGNPNTQSIGNELCECDPFMSPEGDMAYRKFVWLHAYQCKLYGLDPKLDIHGHFEVDPVKRPNDPKGFFNWEMFLEDVGRELAAMGDDKDAQIRALANENYALKQERDRMRMLLKSIASSTSQYIGG